MTELERKERLKELSKLKDEYKEHKGIEYFKLYIEFYEVYYEYSLKDAFNQASGDLMESVYWGWVSWRLI